MKRLIPMVVGLAAGAAVVSASSEASACTPPLAVRGLEATVPAQGATDVSPSTPIVLQFLVSTDYSSSAGFSFGYTVSVLDAAGIAVAEHEVPGDGAWSGSDGWEVATFDPGPLQPSTTYRVQVSDGNQGVEWEFTTADVEPAPLAPSPLQANISAFWGTKPVWDCCPEEFVGQCPNCYTIGTDPIPVVRASFDAVEHVLGDAAWVYSLQSRQGDGATWEDAQVGVGSFDDAFVGAMEVRGDRLAVREYCYRVVARLTFDETAVVESAETCLGPDAFGARPEPQRDAPSDYCGPQTDDEPEDPDVDEPDVDPEVRDSDTDGDSEVGGDWEVEKDSQPEGWELAEDGGSSDSGCCATFGPSRRASDAVLLAGLFGLLVVRRRR